MRQICDFLVIGSGIAGLMSAHYLSEHGSVILVTKRAADISNTNWAQGGISCVMDETDSLDAHVADTLSALANLGFRPVDASRAVAEAQAELGEGASVNELLRVALRKSAR